MNYLNQIFFWTSYSSRLLKYGGILFTVLHFGIGFLYAFFLDHLDFINDPKDFYRIAVSAKTIIDTIGFGHSFMAFIIYPFVKIGCSISLIFFLFSVVSYLAFLDFFKLIKVNEVRGWNRLFLLFFFLPTLHVWTASLSKEALILYCMVIVLKQIVSNSYNIKVFLGLLVIFMIRPHMAFIISIGFIISFLLDSSFKVKTKIIVGFLIVFFTSILLFFMIKFFFKIENPSIETVLTFVSNFYENTIHKQGGGSVISINETNIFERVFYLIFMPLPFLYDIKNAFQMLLSLENTFFIILFILSILSISKLKLKNLTITTKVFLITVVAISILFFASYLYNLGLGNRMRVMFLPYLFFLLIQICDLNKIFNKKNKLHG